jgi:hypothetical protein
MSDRGVRTLEQALQRGDAVSQSLATAYLRHGRTREALTLLADLDGLSSELLTLEHEAWTSELARLQPAWRLDEPRAAYHLEGWFGDGLGLVLAQDEEGVGGGQPRVFDLGGRWVDAPLSPTGLVVGATTWNQGLVSYHLDSPPYLVRHGREAGRWAAQSFDLAHDATGELEEAAPGGELVLLRRPGSSLDLFVFLELESRRITRRFFAGARVVDWERRRVVWSTWDRGRAQLHAAAVDDQAAPTSIEPETPSEVPPRPMGLLADGRVVVGPVLRLLDVDRMQLSSLALPVSRLSGPLRLARDGHDLLGFLQGLPVRLPLDTSDTGGTTCLEFPVTRPHWHPHVDLALVDPGRGPTRILDVNGSTVCELPEDAQPLGWTPGGRGVLVLRARDPDQPGGWLELWTPDGRAPG